MTKILLDSGAFSAWNKGKSIDFKNYISFCLQNIHKVDNIVNLDVIPASPFVKPTKIQAEESVKKGLENYYTLIKNGIPEDKLIHVFHQGEDFKGLKFLIDNDFKYIGISPANDKNTKQKINWLDECMEYLIKNNKPVIKFHGFGVTAFQILLKYPWYSVDSAAWTLRGGAYGLIDLPTDLRLRKKEDYYIRSIFVSKGKAKKVIENNTLFDLECKSQFEVTFRDPVYKKKVSDFLSGFGFNLERMINEREIREAWNAFYLLFVMKSLNVPTKIYLSSIKKGSLRIILRSLLKNDIDPKCLNFLLSYGLDKNILDYLNKVKNYINNENK